MRVITEKYILVQRYADNGQEDHLSLFNTQTGMFVLENIEEYEEAQQQVQADSPKTITPEHPHASMLFDL